MRRPLRLLHPLLFLLFHRVAAITIPFRAILTESIHLSKRSNLTGVPVQNGGNVIYGTTITLGGNNFSVVLDTGSADLWVAGSVSNTEDTGKQVSVAYAVGNVKGNINLATLTFDNYTVDKQAFILVEDSSSFSPTLQSNGFQGLMGLGFDVASVVQSKVGHVAGDTPLSRIFQLNKTTQNFMSLQLARLNDPTDPITGQITISEFISGYESVASQPKLYLKDAFMDASNQHWAIVTDNNGVIGPDGSDISVESIVPHISGGKMVAVLDSGFTFSQVPRKMSDAIYGRVQGASYNTQAGYWTVPCTQNLSLAFILGGVTVPMHPLDIVSNDLSTPNSNGLCIGAFQPISTAFSMLGHYDMILGMNALRNFYTVFDYGNFIEDTSNDRSDPYVQVLSLTNTTTALADFVKVRLNGQDTTGSSSNTLLPASQESHSPISASEKKQHIEGAIARNWPYIFIGCLAFVLSVMGCGVYACCRRKRHKGARAFTKNAYQTIQEPPPPPMHMRPINTGAQYADPYRRHP
ncbi:acid protease [Russula compacta]|nr:acid protease [Russula compacta]